jgi:phosphatidylglycerophosphate synthase
VPSTGYLTNLADLRAAQKPSRGTAAYGRYVNRPAGRVVAAAVHTVGMTPNGATAISAALSTLGLVLLATLRPSLVMGLAVAVLLAAGYVMDSVDGQLARLRGGGSVRGEWLDHTVDCFKCSSLHLAVLICWYRYPPVDDRAILLVPLGFQVVQSVTYFGLILMPFLRKQRSPAPAVAAPVEAEHPLRKWAILPTDYGFLCWTFVLMAWPSVFLGVYSVVFALSAAMLALALRKWWGELGKLDSEAG